MSISNYKKIEALYPNHTFVPVQDEERDPNEIQLIIDDLYASVWMDEYIWFEDNPIDFEWLKEEINYYLKERKT